MRFFAILALSSTLFAQTFQIVPSTAPRGGAGSLLITFVSPAGTEPVALQWKIQLGTDLTAAAQDIVAGEAAKAADKSVTCAAATEPHQESIYNCILAGGKKAIANGTVFIVRYAIKPQATQNTLVVRITNGVAVSERSNPPKTTVLPPVQGTITIR